MNDNDGLMLLKNVGVLVTRPLPQGNNIFRLIQSEGGTPFSFPVLEIQPPDDFIAFEHCLKDLKEYDIVLLVSLSAINSFANGLRQLGLTLTESVKVGVMGRRSEDQCRQYDIPVSYIPTGSMDSEGLLRTLEGVDLFRKKVLIVRGQTGRELLKNELSARDAVVEYVDAYKRIVTSRPTTVLIDQWQSGGIDRVLVTSNSVVDGMFELLGPNALLFQKTPIITISHRISAYCSHKGVVAPIYVSETPADEDVLRCLITSQSESG
ncbi:MAG: hypothetical protein GKR96_07095 [Gammaproteobacteria bacterium]|nr:hypothetical protein [Gammaproteobacteria bacterium]